MNIENLAASLAAVKLVRGLSRAIAIYLGSPTLGSSMKFARVFMVVTIFGLWAVAPLAAQDGVAGNFFTAYQEFQRGERLEREGLNEDAIAKFRYVAAQLGQLKAKNPDWQPLVVDFRLRKTREAIVRLEGSLSDPTLGPPPDLASMDSSEDMLPPVRPPRRDGKFSAPTISISPGTSSNPPSRSPSRPTARTPSSGRGNRESDSLRQRLVVEQQRSTDLAKQIKQSEAELLNVSMELEKTKTLAVDLGTKVSHLEASAEAVSSLIPSGTPEDSKRLEDALAAADLEKEQLTVQMEESATKIKKLSAQLESTRNDTETAKAELAEAKAASERAVADLQVAQTETKEAKAQTGALEAERDTARQEVETLSARVSELEAERGDLIVARDTAQEQVAEALSALEKNAELIEANRQLEQKLELASRQIAGMESDTTAKVEMIASLQSALDYVREQLIGAQTQLKDDRQRFDKLQAVNDQLLSEYDKVTGALAAVKLGDVTAADAKLLQQENEILRGIIMRQIKSQARREQAYRLAQDEMNRLEIRSDTLNDRINELAKPTLELSAAELEMLKRPLITLLDPDAAKMTAQIEIVRPQIEGLQSQAPKEEFSEETLPSSDEGFSTADEDTAEIEPDPDYEELDEASSPNPELPPELLALVNQARDQFINGDFASAEKLYQEVVEVEPNNVVALANLGVAQFRQGKLTAAQLALEKAVQANPQDAFSLTTLGAVLIEQNRIDEAVTILERANQAMADDPITLNYLGVASSQQGKFGRAEESLRRAITVQPDYAEAHFNLSVIYATAKPPSIALAKRHYERALELGASPDRRLSAMLEAGSGS